MKFTVLRRVAVIVLASLSLAHCAKNPLATNEGFTLESERRESALGAQAHADVLKMYAPLDHPALQAYVNEVGQRLAKVSHRPALAWHFTVLDSPDLDAFALPGGYVYVTRGILAYLNSEAELAGLIGHEIAHVTARHGARQASLPMPTGPDPGFGPIFLAGFDSPSGAGLPQAWGRTSTAGYGREHELESFRLGAQYLAKAGYAPQAIADALGVLGKQQRHAIAEARREAGPLVAYHAALDLDPSHDAHLQQIVAEAARYGVGKPRRGRSEYLQQLAGLYFGDSPEQGVVRDNALLHEKLGFAIQFPKDWTVHNGPDRIVAVSPARDALLELQRGPRHDRPLETLQSGLKLDPGARFDSGSLSGFSAAFAAGAQEGRPVVAAAVVFNGVQYLIAGMTRTGEAYARERNALRAAINSFHALSAAEREAARPHTLQITAAQAGTTMARLARHSPLGADAETELRLMNGLYPGGEPRPGQLLKIVQ